MDKFDQCFQLYKDSIEVLDKTHAKQCVKKKSICMSDIDLITDVFYI